VSSAPPQPDPDEEKNAREAQGAQQARAAMATDPFGNTPSNTASPTTRTVHNDPFARNSNLPVRAQTKLAPLLRERIALLQKVRKENNETFDAQERELDKEYRDLTQYSTNIDIAADITRMLATLTRLSYEAYQAGKGTGDALETATEEIGKEIADDIYRPIIDNASSNWSQNGQPDDGAIWAFGRTSVRLYFDLQSPSVWAGMVTSLRDGQSLGDVIARRPRDTLLEAKERLRGFRQQSNVAIDTRMARTQRMLDSVTRPPSPRLP
jgi:hypothetical protein